MTCCIVLNCLFINSWFVGSGVIEWEESLSTTADAATVEAHRLHTMFVIAHCSSSRIVTPWSSSQDVTLWSSSHNVTTQSPSMLWSLSLVITVARCRISVTPPSNDSDLDHGRSGTRLLAPPLHQAMYITRYRSLYKARYSLCCVSDRAEVPRRSDDVRDVNRCELHTSTNRSLRSSYVG